MGPRLILEDQLSENSVTFCFHHLWKDLKAVALPSQGEARFSAASQPIRPGLAASGREESGL